MSRLSRFPKLCRLVCDSIVEDVKGQLREQPKESDDGG